MSVCHAICRAAANGCVCGKLNRSMRQKVQNRIAGGSWGIREYDVRVGCFLSLRPLPFTFLGLPDFGQSCHVCSWMICCRWLFVAVV